jgi:hypothetical protein
MLKNVRIRALEPRNWVLYVEHMDELINTKFWYSKIRMRGHSENLVLGNRIIENWAHSLSKMSYIDFILCVDYEGPYQEHEKKGMT